MGLKPGQMTAKHRKIVAKNMSKNMTRTGIYPLIRDKVIPSCEVCPITKTCEYYREGRKCWLIMKLKNKLADFFYRLPTVKPELDAPVIDLLVDEYAFRFWATLWIFNSDQYRKVFFTERSSSVNKIKSLLGRLGCSPADRRLYGLGRDIDTQNYIEVLRDEENGDTENKE